MLFPGSRTEDILLRKPTRSGNPFSILTVCCRATITALRAVAGRCSAVYYPQPVIRKPRPMGAVSGLFLIGYGGFASLLSFSASPTRSLLVPGAVHQHGTNSFHPDDCRGCDQMVWAYRRSPQQHVS